MYYSDIRYFRYHLYNVGKPHTVDIKIVQRNYLASMNRINIIRKIFNFGNVEDEGYTRVMKE